MCFTRNWYIIHFIFIDTSFFYSFHWQNTFPFPCITSISHINCSDTAIWIFDRYKDSATFISALIKLMIDRKEGIVWGGNWTSFDIFAWIACYSKSLILFYYYLIIMKVPRYIQMFWTQILIICSNRMKYEDKNK